MHQMFFPAFHNHHWSVLIRLDFGFGLWISFLQVDLNFVFVGLDFSFVDRLLGLFVFGFGFFVDRLLRFLLLQIGSLDIFTFVGFVGVCFVCIFLTFLYSFLQVSSGFFGTGWIPGKFRNQLRNFIFFLILLETLTNVSIFFFFQVIWLRLVGKFRKEAWGFFFFFLRNGN